MNDKHILPTQLKKNSISPLWLFTLVAFVLAGWLLYRSISEAGERITIHFQNAQGIDAGRTAIRYEGLDIGIIRKVTLADDLNGVNAEAEIFAQATKLLKKDTLFWVVRPKASITGISGLDALVSGNYIAVQPGHDKEKSKEFVAVRDAPHIAPDDDSLHILLKANDLSALNIGSGVFYKKIQVGEVFNYELSQDRKSVLLSLIIRRKYANLIKDESRFWNISGIQADVGLQGASVKMESLATLLAGGIAFDSPEDGKIVSNRATFSLYPTINEAERGVPITIQLPDDHGITDKHAAIMFEGMEVGKLSGIDFNEEFTGFVANANIDPSMTWLLNSGSQFIINQPELNLSGAKYLSNFIFGNNLSIQAGKGEASNSFTATTTQQLLADNPNALKVRLKTNDLWGIGKSTKVLYHGLEVGFVVQNVFTEKQLYTDIVILPMYKHLIKSDSRFYRLGGISGEINADGVSFDVAPAAQLAQTAISFTSADSNAGSNTTLPGTYTLYSSKSNAQKEHFTPTSYNNLTLVADTLPSISIGSPILYKNVVVGAITNFGLEKGSIKINAMLEKRFTHLLTKDTVFWNQSGIDIQASLAGGVSIDTGSLKSMLIGGIAFGDIANIPNKQGSAWRLYSSEQVAQNQGRPIRFMAKNSHGLSAGGEIRYQGVKIGEIKKLTPAFERDGVTIDAIIYARYADKIARQSSYFWVAQPTLSLLKTENLDSLLSGYIMVSTSNEKSIPLQEFVLHDTEKFTKGLTLVLESDQRDSITVGTPIFFRDIEVGAVTDIALGRFSDRVLISIKIENKYKYLVRENSLFWNKSGIDVSIGLSGADIKSGTVESILRGGITFSTPEGKSLAPAAKEGKRYLLNAEPQKDWTLWRTAIPNPNIQ